MKNEIPKDESQEQAMRLSLALCEMRDSLVRLSLALKDSLFEEHLSHLTRISGEQNATETPTHKDATSNEK